MHDPAQRLASALAAAAAGALGTYAFSVVGLHLLELLVGDDRGMTALCLHPLIFGASHERPIADLDLAEVESVPEEPSCVDGVFKDAANGTL